MNSADFSDGGFTEEESRTVAKRLDEAGLDLIGSCSHFLPRAEIFFFFSKRKKKNILNGFLLTELSGGTYESGGFEHKKESTIKREGLCVAS